MARSRGAIAVSEGERKKSAVNKGARRVAGAARPAAIDDIRPSLRLPRGSYAKQFSMARLG